MTIIIPNLIDPVILKQIRKYLEKADWSDGKATAHGAAKDIKENSQLYNDTKIEPTIRKLFEENAIVQRRVFPKKVLPFFFNRHTKEQFYGKHVDRAIRKLVPRNDWFRCDLSCTIFLNDDYAGGELVIYHDATQSKIKLKAGDAFIYPAGMLHEVLPVTEGTRYAACTWIQSLIPSHEKRKIVSDVNVIANQVARGNTSVDVQAQLSQIQCNLLRMWSET